MIVMIIMLFYLYLVLFIVHFDFLPVAEITIKSKLQVYI